LLKHLYRTFGNWQLALAAYNQGEGHVKKVLKRTATRDAISLANAGHLNEYVAKTTAAMLAIHQLKAI
jgi:soluble lytic murein transglycosylase-like protein